MMLVPSIQNLKNSGSKNMAVDGSSVNKTFSFSPSSGTAVVQRLVILMDDPGAASYSKFGSLNALTNGLVLSVTIGDTTEEITVIKDNADLVTRFDKNHFGSAASDTLGGAVGFGDSYDSFIGVLDFSMPIRLKDSDSIQAVVKDNLSNISTLQISCTFMKEA